MSRRAIVIAALALTFPILFASPALAVPMAEGWDAWADLVAVGVKAQTQGPLGVSVSLNGDAQTFGVGGSVGLLGDAETQRTGIAIANQEIAVTLGGKAITLPLGGSA
jgi:hypothetical protein